MLPQHRKPWGQGIKRSDRHPEQEAILKAVPEIADYVTDLTKHSRKSVTLALRQLLRLVRDYPRSIAARGARIRPLWSLRPGPGRAHDPASGGTRLLSAEQRRRQMT